MSRTRRRAAVALAVLAVVGLTVGGYHVAVARTAAARQAAVAAAWTRFDAAARSADPAAARAALDAVLAVDPADTLAVHRKRALAAGTADADDAPLARLTLRAAAAAGDHTAAEREAEKLLARRPYDWFARCARADAALARGDTAAAAAHLDALPHPDDPRADLDADGLLFAFGLFARTGRDADRLRAFVPVGLVPALRSADAHAAPPAARVRLVECFLEGFDPRPDRPPPAGLSRGWAAAGELLDAAAATDDVAVLAAVGRLTPRLLAGLAALTRAGQVSADQAGPLADEVRDRNRRVWRAVLARRPADAAAYHALALDHCQRGDTPAARELLARGRAACGDDPALTALSAVLLQADGRHDDAAVSLTQAALADAKNPGRWLAAAEAWDAAGRRDRALAACAKGREAAPADPGLVRLEARLWLAAGDPHRAVQLLRRLPPNVLAADPGSADTYARALAAAGLGVLSAAPPAVARPPAPETP